PNGAVNKQSINSTIEWTVDWGWISTEIFSTGRSKSHLASRTSKPLFISVAESMVTRFPMFQVGFFNAISGVTVFICLGENSRNGPPEAVSITLHTSCFRPERRH